MQTLTHNIAKHISVIQIGVTGDPILHSATTHLFDLTPQGLQEILANSACTVSFENGISHWCGHIGAPCVTLYVDLIKGSFPVHTGYNHQIAILKNDLTIDRVLYTVLKTAAKQIRKKVELLNI